MRCYHHDWCGTVTIDLIIVNYFSSSMISGLLGGIERDAFRKIVLVDNSDDDVEFTRISRISGEYGADALRMDGNKGFGAAVNRGVEHANPGSDGFIWILNPDTKPEANAARKLADYLNASDFDMISPSVVTGDTNEVDIWFGGGEFDRKYGRTKHLKVPPAGNEISFITGAALMARAASWISLGGFREDLFMYWEDADLSLRALNAGMRLGINPDVRVWHAVGATSHAGIGRSDLFHYYMQRNRILVLAEHFGVPYLLGPRRLLETVKMGRRAMVEKHQPSKKALASIRGLLAGGREVARRRRTGTSLAEKRI